MTFAINAGIPMLLWCPPRYTLIGLAFFLVVAVGLPSYTAFCLGLGYVIEGGRFGQRNRHGWLLLGFWIIGLIGAIWLELIFLRNFFPGIFS